MPFTKITSGPNKGSFKSPSGRIMTGSQVKAYYTKEGNKPKRGSRAKTNKKTAKKRKK